MLNNMIINNILGQWRPITGISQYPQETFLSKLEKFSFEDFYNTDIFEFNEDGDANYDTSWKNN